MSPDDIPSTKNSSIFLSLFSRKKRSNRSVTESSDDSKKVSSPSSTSFLTNGKANSNTNITHANGFSNFKNSETLMVPLESASTSWANEFQPPQPSSFQQQQQLQQCEPARTDFTFTDHKRYHKNSRMHQPENSTSSQSNFLSNVRSRSESRSMLERSPILSIPKKAYSVGAVNHSDPGYLMEALETLADAQPRVARSIPKHAIVDTSGFAARSLDNCLFDATVYDAMLHDSLKVCEMLQNHLNQCIVTARTKCSNGCLEAVTEENEEDTEVKCDQNQFNNSAYHPAAIVTNGTLASSSSDEVFHSPVELSAQLKTKIQIKEDY